MKNLCALITFAAILASSAGRAETASSYVGEITGLVCASCKQEVVGALSKMEGVKNVEIVPGNDPEIRKITIHTTSTALTAAEINKTLDKVSKEFKVTKLARAGAPTSK